VHLASKFAKSVKKTQNKLFMPKMENKYDKHANLHAGFQTVEKVAINVPIKRYKETNWMSMSQSGKSAYFHHILFITFLCFIYLQLFLQC
jgi:hypothetical protein